MDEATLALANDLADAMTRPFTPEETADADAERARWDRASDLFDVLIEAAKTGSVDLTVVETAGPTRFVIDAWRPGTRDWLRVAELLLPDVESPTSARS